MRVRLVLALLFPALLFAILVAAVHSRQEDTDDDQNNAAEGKLVLKRAHSESPTFRS